ncbi:3-keto-5-aminohexanoate cleavage protein [Streptomyces sp. NPDC050625]|uniref:3-keto-5-aminohexanoate cleavage protein n=1 Tax=Streptomyces sp. NPDC050625 TaxID=3154629 RepID=UPI003417471E
MTHSPTWVEVARNGPWRRDLQPLVPLTPDEIVADGILCAEAGACTRSGPTAPTT